MSLIKTPILKTLRFAFDYIFEYFNNYLNMAEAEEITLLHNEKLDKYRQLLNDYEPEVREWLLNMFAEYGKHMHKNIGNVLRQYEFFLLYSTENEFRSTSYDCYSQLIKRFPFLKDQTEMLFLFIKEYHRIQGQRSIEHDKPFISEDIDHWIESTWKRYQVNVLAFAFDWVNRFYSNESIWPSTHKKRNQQSQSGYEYDYKQKSNLFNLDSLYRKMPQKAFTKGKKQELEILMMYYWLHSMVGDDENYWQAYLIRVLSALNKS